MHFNKIIKWEMAMTDPDREDLWMQVDPVLILSDDLWAEISYRHRSDCRRLGHAVRASPPANVANVFNSSL